MTLNSKHHDESFANPLGFITAWFHKIGAQKPFYLHKSKRSRGQIVTTAAFPEPLSIPTSVFLFFKFVPEFNSETGTTLKALHDQKS